MKSLAIVGSGIAGMACAYFLRDRYQITVYEKNQYAGGHTNTVSVSENGRGVPVDTGFMVYNDRTYPNLIRFFEHLGVEAKDTSMSFSVNDVRSGFETSFTSLNTFFPSAGDWLKPEKYKLLFGLKRLFAEAKEFLERSPNSELTLKAFIEQRCIDQVTTQKFLLPMTAAIWSTPTARMLDYPAATLFRFLSNHGMLGFNDPFQWKTLKGGSRQYKSKILDKVGDSIRIGCGVAQVRRESGQVKIVDAHGNAASFDGAIIATHADQALDLLDQPTPLEEELLGSFRYNVNPVVLHSDSSVMPTKRRAWASWNYRYEQRGDATAGSTHYWMNSLQGVSEKRDYFVSVDYDGPVDPEKTHWSYTYEHPRFDANAIRAQSSLSQLNIEGPLYFCGSYFRYGFHEDAFSSAINVVSQLNDGKDPLS